LVVRPYWKGYLKLALVSSPIALYAACSTAARIAFRQMIALEAYDKGLLGTTLRYPYEVRKAEDYCCDLPDVTIAPDLLTLAGHIVDSKATDFDPSTFRDRYEEALLAHLKAKQASTIQERKPTVAAPHGVVNLMEALRRSAAEDKNSPPCAGKWRRRANGHECHAGARQ
jgi:DNA end-binding protein Ku